jgi:Ca-activated chloride channel family protein
MTPRFARALVIAAAAVAVLAAAAGRDDQDSVAEQPELVLRYLYSTDATSLLEPLIERYNREPHTRDGRDVRIDGFALASGQAEAALAARDERAALWTPASSLWAELLNHHVFPAEWVPAGQPVNLVYSPQVIAMWKPFARALGPEAKIGWKDILALTTSSRGWAEYGQDYGPFLLGHTNPGISTSGLSAVASHYYALTGKQSDLSLADVQRPAFRAAVQRIERSVVHQGETASKLIDKMLLYGEPYAHAVYVQETTLRGLKPSQAARLTWFKPADGTFVADYPLIVLAAPWVSSDARAAAEAFRRWLVPKITAKKAAAYHFEVRRPAGLAELEPPEPDVLAAMQDAWHEDRKPANIVLVVDTSNSMATDGRLGAAKQGLLSFLRALESQDRVALITSSELIETKVRLGVIGTRRRAVLRAVSGLSVRGDAPIYAAVSEARDSLRALDDPDRINAVVVLSDGAGTSVGSKKLLREIDSDPVTEGTSVRIFTVAYGQTPDAVALRQIASDSDGLFFTGGPKDINAVYQKILSYF